MLRIRFHGRGGQGIKTASRIIGAAAFMEGYHAQDSPLYGAERRGAPIVAFTRISKEPILERGIIYHPDILVISDETLLDDPSAEALHGVAKETVVIINTHFDASHVMEVYGLPNKIICIDLTEIALRVIGKSALSAVAASSACRVVNCITEGTVRSAVRTELMAIGLKSHLIEKNIEAAIICFDNTPKVTLHTPRRFTIRGGQYLYRQRCGGRHGDTKSVYPGKYAVKKDRQLAVV